MILKKTLAPPRTKFILHENTNIRLTWVQHGIQGWYIGPSVENYQCYKVYISNTRSERITETVELFTDNTMIIGISSTNAATHIETDLIKALKNLSPASLFDTFGIKNLNALIKLAEIFQGQIT